MTKEQIGLDRITPSMIAEYEACPKLFFYKSWLGLKLPQDQRHMQFGTAFHEAIQYAYLLYDRNFGGGWQCANDTNQIEEVKDKFLQNFKLRHISDEEFENVLKLKTNKFQTKEELYESMKNDGLEMIEAYWKEKENLLLQGVEFHETEIPMKMEIINPEDKTEKLPIPISLRLDGYSFGREAICELKTSSGLYDEAETREKIQGLAYVFAHYQQTGKIIPCYYVVADKTKYRIQVIKLVFDEADMVGFYYRVKSVLQKIANREFDMGRAEGFTRWELEKYQKALNVDDYKIKK